MLKTLLDTGRFGNYYRRHRIRYNIRDAGHDVERDFS